MSDKVELQIAGRRINNFLSYEVDSDLYQAADKFTLELAKPETQVSAGDPCELYVNGVLELTGIVDVTRKSWDKRGDTLTLEGRDLMGLAVDSYVEQFVDVKNQPVKELAKMLLARVPYLNRKPIIGGNFVGRGKGKRKTVDTPITGFMDVPQRISHISPGMTVFEVLNIYAASRGLMLYSLADGTVVFGRPKASGAATFSIICDRSGKGNVLSGNEDTDISARYSKVTVVSQVQGYDDFGMDAGKVISKKSVQDKSWDLFYKPYVTVLNNDSQTPELHGRMLLERMRHEGYRLSYTARDHSQNGRNFTINELVQVEDERFGVKRQMLLHGRTFRRSRESGTTTQLRLGLPGLVAA